MKAKTFEVTYTKRIGGTGIILVKAVNEIMALNNARFLCATGTNFRNAIESGKNYIKPRRQGFQGRQ